MERLIAAGSGGLAVLGFEAAEPGRYGRLVLGEAGLERIVEAADADSPTLAIRLCNAGLMAGDAARFRRWLAAVEPTNAQGEYYLTDCVALARADGLRVPVVTAAERDVHGVNTRAQLAEAEALAQARLRQAAMAAGATLIDPASTFFSYDTTLGRDVVVGPSVVFLPGVEVADDVEIRAFSHLEGCRIERGALIGPFARLRPGAVIGAGAHVGNFVELKAAHLGAGAKANHLSYLGDAEIGAGANIGAGTITCNYDGFFKHRTVIGAGAFIGSNSALVAPVTIGDGALVGAGSTIVRDVPADAAAIARGEQISRQGAAARIRERKRRQKEAG
jgi:bifunctional UDP-N-acetylglucosamine pyrophosphorylase/glucosamine-1-phosphate N-acetyltransferase